MKTGDLLGDLIYDWVLRRRARKLRRGKLSFEAKNLVISRLGKVVDELHAEARGYDDHMGNRTTVTDAFREAADYLSELRKGLQR